jgi:hypothetical protein
VACAAFAFLRFRLGHAEDDFMDRAVARVDCEADLVAFLGLRPGALRLGRQFRVAVFVGLKQDAVLRHVGIKPGALRGRESFAVDSEAIVLVSLGEQVLLPNDVERSPFVLAEFCILREEASLFESLGDLPPNRALALLRLELLPGRGLISRGAEAMVRNSRSFGMSPAPI